MLRRLAQSTGSALGTLTHRATRVAAVPVVLALVSGAATRVRAQSDSGKDRKSALFESIRWITGPIEGRLASIATLSVPAGCRFTEEKGAKTFMEVTENPPSGGEVGLLLCEIATGADTAQARRWFVVFDFDESGYVKDDEKAELDAAKILATLQENQREGNKERRKRGWTELTLDGWVRPPYYDQSSHNLTWATRILAEGDTTVNHSVRLLGRSGVMSADLIVGPDIFERSLPTFERMVATTKFTPGKTYAEWREGDKVANYGLTALVAGGAGAAAMKLGLFGKLWKVIAGIFAAAGKAIIAAVAGVAAWVRSIFRKKSSQKDLPSTP